MTYEEHKVAVEKAAVALYRTVQDAKQENLSISPRILRVLLLGGECQYLVDMDKPSIIDIDSIDRPLSLASTKEWHEKAVADAATDLANAFTAAAKDHYCFLVHMIGTEFAEAMDAKSAFLSI